MMKGIDNSKATPRFLNTREMALFREREGMGFKKWKLRVLFWAM